MGKKQDRTCCGVIEEAAEAAREKRENRQSPPPWIARKLMVAFTWGIIGYAGYVYIARLCLPMIQRRPGVQGGKDTGVALLVVFCVIYLWLIWAYLRIVLTPPGYAKDHVPKSERPFLPATIPLRESWQSTDSIPTIDVEPAQLASQRASTTSRPPTSTSMRRDRGLAGPSYEDLLKRAESRPSDAQDPNAGVLNAIPVPKPVTVSSAAVDSTNNNGTASGSDTTHSHTVVSPHTHVRTQSSSSPLSATQTIAPPAATHRRSSNAGANKLVRKDYPTLNHTDTQGQSYSSQNENQTQKKQKRSREEKEMYLNRRPSATPVLLPAHRYCGTEGLVKPYRAHHCRMCGKCVLRYDHHCPWIGQCVGARNHKYFINFNQATVVFTAYVLATLITFTVKESNATFMSDIDPQKIVLIGLAGLFFIFTIMLLASHIGLILTAQTTVESMKIRSMKEREDHVLANVYNLWEVRAKKRKRAEWDREWGALRTEGNIWWRGNAHEEWTDVMGKSWLGWILPFGRPLGDGLSYPVNPRFDADGRWRRRAEWPETLR
ncbi:hypothetical protein D9619_009102 [Psilocybe cf. subviscida]|uniref:Palmitoyltransferase n=1 Tax=Psilocybe cf. subviscida TaxID=2480587 RepID=A0A8H5FA71_9AGAR|nr:hypothetical protein D9619_009102 [Psilocybe cf. subviscida]